MRLPELAIRNHQFTTVAILALVVTGAVSLATMPRSEDPQVSPPGTDVVIVFPGAGPQDVEQLAVDPLERAIHELEDIDRLETAIRDGVAVISVRFRFGTDADDKYAAVLRKVNATRAQLPEGILRLDVIKWSTAAVNILQVALVSDDAAYAELERLAEDLKERLETVSGVRKAQTWAYPKQEVRVSMDLERMAAMHVGLPQVLDALAGTSRSIPGGAIAVGDKKLTVKTSGSFTSLEQIQRTIVALPAGKPVYLQDVAEVAFDAAEHTHRGRVNGRRAVFVTAQQKEATNIFEVRKQLASRLQHFAGRLPTNVEQVIVFDQAKSVSQRLSSFAASLGLGVLLVGAVVLLALGFRASAIVALAIPASVLIGLGWVDLAGFGLEQMSITGLVIALGLLVDNAIVVTESVSRLIRQGMDPRQAASEGAGQVAWPIISATATTVLAFVPIVMMNNMTGQFIRSMPVTVVFTLTASLLVALTLTPHIASRLHKDPKSIERAPLQRRIEILIAGPYRNLLGHALRRPKTTLTSAALFFVASLALAGQVGVSFFPKAEKPQFLINVDMPQGTSLEKTDAVVRRVEQALAPRRQVALVASHVGHGIPRIYYNVIPRRTSSSYAQLLVQLSSFDRKETAELIAALRAELGEIAGARIEVKELEQGPPVVAPIAIKVFCDNLDLLDEIAGRVERLVRHADGTVNVRNPLATSATELQLAINRDKAGLAGLSVVAIDQTVRVALAGVDAATLRGPDGDELDVVVRLPVEGQPTLAALDSIVMMNAAGGRVPLLQVAQAELARGPAKINHYKLDRAVTITADVLPGRNVNEVTHAVLALIDSQEWPRGIRFAAGGELESREESFGGMLQAIIIAMLAIFGVLVLQFRSYVQPLIVFSALPLAIIGSVLTLYLTGYSFSFTAFVGLTSLVGIVVNNSIILVDLANSLRRAGSRPLDAVCEAGEVRFVPIILTTATTIGGLLPLTLQGGTLWAPMGWTIIGGLVVSTLLTLVIVPVLYALLTGSQKGVSAREVAVSPATPV